MSVFVFAGGWTVGRNVIATMGGDIVPPEIFTLRASIVVLFFIGLGMLIANLFGVPVPTSMTAVGAIAGLARGEESVELSTSVLTQEPATEVPKIGEEEPEDVLDADDLVRPDAVARFVAFWIIGPSASAGLAYVFFLAVPI